MTLRVQTTPEADAQIREIDAWWRVNRRDSPDLFADELARFLELVREAPGIGKAYRQGLVRGARRALLLGSRYHVYYVVRSDEVWVLAVWHARRGRGPPLRLKT